MKIIKFFKWVFHIPLHKHDCTECTYLGQFHGSDLYYCDKQSGYPTLIERWNSEGSEYSSGMMFGWYNREDPRSPLGEAWRRAKKMNLELPSYENKLWENGYTEFTRIS